MAALAALVALVAGCGSSTRAAPTIASGTPGLSATTSLPAMTSSPTSTAVPGTSGQATTVVADCGTGAYRPARIVVTCGNSSVVATEIQWSQWTTTGAVGESVVQVDPCKPNCAAESAKPFDAQVTLSDPVMTSQGPRFSKLTLTWKGAQPFGHATDSYPLPTS